MCPHACALACALAFAVDVANGVPDACAFACAHEFADDGAVALSVYVPDFVAHEGGLRQPFSKLRNQDHGLGRRSRRVRWPDK